MKRLKPLQNEQFGSEIKNAKRLAAKQFYKKIKVVLCKEPLQKTLNNQERTTILKIDHLAKAKAHAKAIDF